jgi:DNA repair protein RadD
VGKPIKEPILIQLRDYQQAAVDAVYQHLADRDDNPCVVIPTGGGKTPVIATIGKDAVMRWDGRVLILAHVKELLEQAADKLRAICPEVDFGIYSAGLKRRDTEHPVIIAGIQSVYRRACDLGQFDLVVIDEAHMIPPDGDGMYRQLLEDMLVINPHVRVVGLTATPFRMKSGSICTPDGYLNEVCYEIGVRELIVQGFLSPLRTRAGAVKADTSGLHIRAGEFVAVEVENLMDQDELVRAACQEIIEQTQDRRSVLIFTSGVRHGRHVVDMLQREHGVECGFVEGQTPSVERDAILQRFKLGELKYLANVNVLTTGFDAPAVDCVSMLRPTMSPGLYYQMVGRGFRLHPGKADCLVLDFGGNVMRHGPVDQISATDPQAGTGEAPVKECPECHALIHAAYGTCPECGFAFPDPEKNQHSATAHSGGILSDQHTDTKHAVRKVFYSVHTKRDAPDDAPKTLRVEYEVGYYEFRSEWVCFEHPRNGYARQKAEAWWRARSDAPVPDTAAEAVELAHGGVLADTVSVTIRSVPGEKYDRIVDHELGDNPQRQDAEPEYVMAEDEIPF